jgi:hypothetical protein
MFKDNRNRFTREIYHLVGNEKISFQTLNDSFAIKFSNGAKVIISDDDSMDIMKAKINQTINLLYSDGCGVCYEDKNNCDVLLPCSQCNKIVCGICFVNILKTKVTNNYKCPYCCLESVEKKCMKILSEIRKTFDQIKSRDI